MGAPIKQFLVRRVADGTMRTVNSTSCRAAITEFICKYVGLEEGEDLSVKERSGSADWEVFRYQGVGKVRKVG